MSLFHAKEIGSDAGFGGSSGNLLKSFPSCMRERGQGTVGLTM